MQVGRVMQVYSDAANHLSNAVRRRAGAGARVCSAPGKLRQHLTASY